ncbi:MAG TPA: site-2 protease family protein [bacterium]|jgi:membrane-associated protease RseP (regulator of RpoE activity)
MWRRLLTAVGVIGTTVAIHEGAHAVVAVRSGGKVREIGVGFGPALFRTRMGGIPVVLRALPLGGYAAIDIEQMPARRRIPLLLAGPLANIAVGAQLLAATQRQPAIRIGDGKPVGFTGFIGTMSALIEAAGQGPGAVARLAGAVNLGVGLMNLLPIYPLDGGHIAMSAMEARGVSERTRSVFARLSVAIFFLITQMAMVGDLRRLAANREQRTGNR